MAGCDLKPEEEQALVDLEIRISKSALLVERCHETLTRADDRLRDFDRRSVIQADQDRRNR